jgi:hypothetical protein
MQQFNVFTPLGLFIWKTVRLVEKGLGIKCVFDFSPHIFFKTFFAPINI